MNVRIALIFACVGLACSPPPAQNPVGTGKSEVKSIGSSGGSITLEAVTLTIPANAVPSDTSFTITSSTTAAGANYTAYTPVYVFNPANTDYATPLTVEFDIGEKTTKQPVVYWTRKGSSVFERRPTTVNGSKISAQVTHFSMGFVGEAPTGGDAGTIVVQPGNFTILDLDPAARSENYIAMAIHGPSQKIGVAYITPRGQEYLVDAGARDAGPILEAVQDYDVKYVEVVNGTPSTPETITLVQRPAGVAIDFDAMGRPVVSFLGGATGFEMGQSIFWFQSDAVVHVRTAPGTWQENVINRDGSTVRCGNPVSDTGFLVGLFPAIKHNAAGQLYMAYRDAHNGQYPIGDWAGSDVEIFEDALGARRGVCGQAGGNDKQGYGGRIKMVIGPDDQPAILYDRPFGSATGKGEDVLFQRRQTSGQWTPAAFITRISDTMTGASFAWHATEGWGVTVTDRQNHKLLYQRNRDPAANTQMWESPTEVFASGTGGWYPSLALDTDPMFPGEPSIAFYVCSRRDNVLSDACPQDQDDLRIARRTGTNWQFTLVDSGGGYAPQLGFLNAGKRVVAYRVPAALRVDTNMKEPTAGAVKLAIER